MKPTRPCAAVVIACAVIFSMASGQTSWTISSPGDKVKAVIQFADLSGQADYPAGARLYYSVSAGGPTAYSDVLQPSPMGLTRSDRGFVSGLTFVSEGLQRTIDSTYTMVTGKRRACRNYCNEKILTFQASAGGSQLEVYIRAYDDGFAFRYRFPETNAASLTVTSEATGFRPPASSVMWMLSYNTTADMYAPAYEDVWKRGLPVGAGPGVTAKPTDSTWCMPALVRTPAGYWALLWETDVSPSYCNSHLSKASQLVYRITFPNANEWNGVGSATPSSTLPWTMPWRVVIAGTSPGTILESTLSTDLAAPSTLTDVSWIIPGRSSWSWWSDATNNKDYDTLTKFVDLAQQMTWEYSCVDGVWDAMTRGTWQQIIAYAKTKNVGINLWYNSAGPTNAIPATPRDLMYDSITRVPEFQRISAAGAKGVKIDFWLSDKQSAVKQYCDVFRDAAKYHLIVNIHGSTIPRGWQRTYPNLVSSEAIRGAENYKWYPDDPARFPWQNTMMPFIRNAVASMDWTPVTFTSIANAHLTTYGHELALSVIFESGIQHFADRVAGYQTTTISAGAQAFLKEVPAAWDDTKYVQGYPGSWVVLARRKGTDWYAAGIVGDTARNVTVKLSFLQASPASYRMTLITDGASATNFGESADTVVSGDSIKINIPLRGGWVARFVNLNQVAPRGPSVAAQTNLAPAMPKSFMVAGESFAVPAAYAGKKTVVSLYSPDGSLLKSMAIDKRVVSFKKDLAISAGVYVVRLLAR
jgi:hypothetical protein